MNAGDHVLEALSISAFRLFRLSLLIIHQPLVIKLNEKRYWHARTRAAYPCNRCYSTSNIGNRKIRSSWVYVSYKWHVLLTRLALIQYWIAHMNMITTRGGTAAPQSWLTHTPLILGSLLKDPPCSTPNVNVIYNSPCRMQLCCSNNVV